MLSCVLHLPEYPACPHLDSLLALSSRFHFSERTPLASHYRTIIMMRNSGKKSPPHVPTRRTYLATSIFDQPFISWTYTSGQLVEEQSSLSRRPRLLGEKTEEASIEASVSRLWTLVRSIRILLLLKAREDYWALGGSRKQLGIVAVYYIYLLATST